MNTKFVSGATLTALAAASLLALGACNREADHASRADAGAATSDTGVRPSRANYATSDYGSSRSSAVASSADRDAEVRKAGDGKPLWASNRQRSGEENAQKQFERNGADFSAASLDAYVKTAHAFLDSPPKGALTVARRNGDVLYYDPKANIFAVADREGAPRTMFKPRDGMSYWQQQKQSANDSSRRRDSSRTASRDDRGNGGGGGNSDDGGEG
ncbi:MAG TPA: hypothetical protein VIJ94_10190 [Caulobacteraceae bacterium]